MYKYENNTEVYDDAVIIDFKNILEKILFAISKYWIQLLLFIIVICELLFAATMFTYKPQYTASVSYLINKTGEVSSDSNVSTALGTAINEAIRTSGYEEILEDEYNDNQNLLDDASIKANYDAGTNILTLTVQTQNYKDTKKLLKVVEKTFPQYASSVVGTVSLSEMGKMETEEAPTNKISNGFVIVIGILIGIFLCICFIIGYVVIRKTVRRKEDMRDITSMSCLEETPMVKIKKHSGLVNTELLCIKEKRKNDAYYQSMQSLRQRVEKTLLKKQKKIIMVTSSVAEEGKSTIAANLALLLAQRNYKVLLIDMDLYHPTQMEFFKTKENNKGILEYLNGNEDWRNLVHKNKYPIDIIAGRYEKNINPTLFLKNKMKKMMTELKLEYDFIVIDTPPTSYMADACYISKAVDAVLYVVRQDYASKKNIEDGINAIDQEASEHIGFILNGVDNKLKTNDKYGYRNYGYHYYGKKSD